MKSAIDEIVAATNGYPNIKFNNSINVVHVDSNRSGERP